MHPAFLGWWKHHHDKCGSAPHEWFGSHFGGGHCGTPEGDDDHSGGFDPGGFGSGPFGVRRPLRFLAFKLQLTEEQVAEFAVVLDELKTARAQASVDYRRSVSAFADLVSAPTFDQQKADAICAERVQSAQRVQAAVSGALGRMHAVLTEEQRRKLAYLLRTGAMVI